tara:strand:- start:59 stop:283 length:225 start_codon:yes stop_codon:yes gene_type:complete
MVSGVLTTDSMFTLIVIYSGLIGRGTILTTMGGTIMDGVDLGIMVGIIDLIICGGTIIIIIIHITTIIFSTLIM